MDISTCSLELEGNWDDQIPLIEFSYNNSFQTSLGMASYEALCGRRCRSPSCWFEIGERQILGPELVEQKNERIALIRDRLLAAQSRQASYADNRRRDLEFPIGDKVFVTISPWKGIIRFGKKGKLSPRFVGPFDILDRIGDVSYQVALPPSLADVHNVFHVSMLRKYVHDPTHVFDFAPLHVREDMTYEEQPVEVLDFREETLCNKTVLSHPTPGGPAYAP